MYEYSNENEMNEIKAKLRKKKIKMEKSPIIMPKLSKILKKNVNLLQHNQKVKRFKDNLLLNSYSNKNNISTNLPEIITSHTPIERRNNYKMINISTKNKRKNDEHTRNFGLTIYNNNSNNYNYIGSQELNNTFQIKKIRESNNQNINRNFISTQYNIGKNNHDKIKFQLNKDNSLYELKKPMKINLKSKNNKKFIDIINNYNDNKKKLTEINTLKEQEREKSPQFNIQGNTIMKHISKDLKLNSKSFIESKLNNLVSQAKELKNIISNTEEINNLSNKDENKDLEIQKLQKENEDLNSKITILKEKNIKYEQKINELVNSMEQLKQTNTQNTNVINSQNLTLEGKPKRKKIKFGFVELIFMHEEKLTIINKKKLPKYTFSEKKTFTLGRVRREPKLIFKNMNNNTNNDEGKATEEDYIDAAEQIANNIIIESLNSIKLEDEENF